MTKLCAATCQTNGKKKSIRKSKRNATSAVKNVTRCTQTRGGKETKEKSGRCFYLGRSGVKVRLVDINCVAAMWKRLKPEIRRDLVLTLCIFLTFVCELKF